MSHCLCILLRRARKLAGFFGKDRTRLGMDGPRQQLLELDRRYRLILHSTDHIDPEILDDVQSEVKGRYFAIVEEIAEHRLRYPELFAAIELKYRQACAEQPVEAEDLVAFGYEENLLLTGETGPVGKLALP